MTVSRVIVIALRFVLPTTIFRWPVAGAIISMVLDGVDVILVDILAKLFGETGGFGTFYQPMDKWLDIYYLSFEVIVSWRWSNPLLRYTSISLFVYRFVGLVLFEVTGARIMFFIFPNLFENFFLYYVITAKYAPRLVPANPKQLILVLALLYIPKFGQEYLLHFTEAKPWSWFKSTVLP